MQFLSKFQSKKKKKSLEDATSLDPLDSKEDAAQQQHFQGMNRVSETSYEVWLHEDCIIWAPNVFLVGARVMGLDAAVWNSMSHLCVLCQRKGAIVCCLQRDCKLAAHVPCARESGWNISESSLRVYCDKHGEESPVADLKEQLSWEMEDTISVATETGVDVVMNSNASKALSGQEELPKKRGRKRK